MASRQMVRTSGTVTPSRGRCNEYRISTFTPLLTPAGELRSLPNRYPAFSGDEPMAVEHRGPVFMQAPASGIHEVLVLGPEHGASWADLPDDHAEQVMTAIRDRMAAHAHVGGLRYSQGAGLLRRRRWTGRPAGWRQ